MNFTIRILVVAGALSLVGCTKPDTAIEKKPEKPVVIGPTRTAMSVIKQTHATLGANCGRDLDEVDLEGLEVLDVYDAERAEADALLQEIGLYAQQCGNYTKPREDAQAGCDPSCHWCPVKWYWCIENAGACVGGDNESCCKLGACGSKHHCEEVCQSSCGCNVPPLPSDGGGDGGDD